MTQFTEKHGSLFTPGGIEVPNHLVGIVYSEDDGILCVHKIANAFIASEYFRDRTEKMLLGGITIFDLKLHVAQMSADDLNAITDNPMHLRRMFNNSKDDRFILGRLKDISREGGWIPKQIRNLWGHGIADDDTRRAAKAIDDLFVEVRKRL